MREIKHAKMNLTTVNIMRLKIYYLIAKDILGVVSNKNREASILFMNHKITTSIRSNVYINRIYFNLYIEFLMRSSRQIVNVIIHEAKKDTNL